MRVDPPYDYQLANEIIGSVSPSYIHVDGSLSRFFRRYLLETAISVFEWKIPKLWAKNYLLYCIYGLGYIAVIDTEKYGVIPQQCGLGGYNVFYQPAFALITNPRIKTAKTEYAIGSECEIIQLQPDYGGVMDLVSYYGDMMALCAQSAATNITNSKLAYIFATDHKAAAETFKKLADQVNLGKPAMAVDKELFDDQGKPRWTTFSQNLTQNYIADKIMLDLQKYQAEFMRAVGIPTVGMEKKERLITDEISIGNSETKNRADLWLEMLQIGCDKVNQLFGDRLESPISVDWRYNPEPEEVVDNAGMDER